jgi:thymidine kinase
VWTLALDRLKNMVEDYEVVDSQNTGLDIVMGMGTDRDRDSGSSGSVAQEIYPEQQCDVLIIDEAQLYPAETVFHVLLLWFRPRKVLLLGMDSKQAGAVQNST